MLLNNIREVDICDANKNLVRFHAERTSGVVDEEGFINLSVLQSPQDQTTFLDQFCENERLHTQQIKGICKKEKYKANYIIMFLIAGLTLVGTGFFIAPLLIVNPIILPIASILLLSGVAIIALTKLYLNTRLYFLETRKLQAEAFFDKVVASKVSNENDVGIYDVIQKEIQELKTTNEVMNSLSTKMDTFLTTNQGFFASHSKFDDETKKFDDNEKNSDLRL